MVTLILFCLGKRFVIHRCHLLQLGFSLHDTISLSSCRCPTIPFGQDIHQACYVTCSEARIFSPNQITSSFFSFFFLFIQHHPDSVLRFPPAFQIYFYTIFV